MSLYIENIERQKKVIQLIISLLSLYTYDAQLINYIRLEPMTHHNYYDSSIAVNYLKKVEFQRYSSLCI